MASSLNETKTIEQMIDEDLAKYRARAERDQERIDELEARNTHFADELRSSLVVPSAAFAMGYVRGYYGEKATIFGMSIDAGVSLFFHGIAAFLGCVANKGAQTVAKLFHGVANGALACWTAATGAELGLKKRMETPVPAPAPQPVMGAQETPQRAPRPMTHEELAAIKADMPHGATSPLTHEELAAFAAFAASPALNTQPPMQERPPAPAPPAPTTNALPKSKAEAVAPKVPARAHAPQSPAQSPAPPKTNPLPKAEAAEAVAPKAPVRAPVPQSPAPHQSRSNTQQSSSVNAESAPEARSTREKPFRFTQRGQVDGESGLTTLLRSFGIPPVSETPNWPSPEYSIENFDKILRWARAPT